MRDVLGTWQATYKHGLVNTIFGRKGGREQREGSIRRQRRGVMCSGKWGEGKAVGVGTYTCSSVSIKIMIEFGRTGFQRRKV